MRNVFEIKLAEVQSMDKKCGNVPQFQFLADEDDDASRSFVYIFPLRGNI